MFIHTNRKEVVQLPTGHNNGVSTIDECMPHETHTWRQQANEVEETRHEQI